MALGFVTFAFVAAPFCRCTCAGHGTAAAAEAPSCHPATTASAETPSCHRTDPTPHRAPAQPDHACEHAGCATMSAALPTAPAVHSAPATPTQVAVMALAALPSGIVLGERGARSRAPDRDIGPPVPGSPFQILRP